MTNPGKTLHILLGSIIKSKPVAKEADLKSSTTVTERFVPFKKVLQLYIREMSLIVSTFTGVKL